MGKNKNISVKEAAEMCGVSSQTILNWGERGIVTLIRTNKRKNKNWYYLPKEQIESIVNVAYDINKTKETIEREKQQLIESEKMLYEKLKDIKVSLRLVRTMEITKTAQDFFAGMIHQFNEIGSINDRETEILQTFVSGQHICDIAEKHGITKSRVLQIIERACARIMRDTKLTEIKEERDELRTKYAELTAAYRVCSENLKKYVKEEEMKTIGEVEEYLKETDSLIKLFATRCCDIKFKGRWGMRDLSVRSLNCLKCADIETIGDLVRRKRTDLLRIRNFGRKSLCEIEEMLEEYKLTFDMDVDKIYAERTKLYLEKNDKKL